MRLTLRWDLLKCGAQSGRQRRFGRALIDDAQKWNQSTRQRYELLNSDVSTILLAIMIRYVVSRDGNKGHAS